MKTESIFPKLDATPSSPHAATLIHNYTVAHIVHSLIEVNAFEKIKNSMPIGITLSELSIQCDVYDRVLGGILDYLSLSDTILFKNDNLYKLKPGSEWLFDISLRYEMLLALGAYQSILSNLTESLTREKKYGADFIRDGKKLATASFGVTKENYPFVIEELERLGVKRVADLGCGAAEVLISFCRMNPNLTGIGIDIDPSALEEAKRRVEIAGLSNRIKLVQGDITKPHEWYDLVKDFNIQAFTCIGVLHEFLRDGNDYVANIMAGIKNAFPGAYFFLGEFDAQTDNSYLSKGIEEKTKDLWYQHIIHPLSMQGLPISREAWTQLFDGVGIKRINVKKFFLDQFVFQL